MYVNVYKKVFYYLFMDRRDFFKIAGLSLVGLIGVEKGLDCVGRFFKKDVSRKSLDNVCVEIEGDLSRYYNHYVATPSFSDKRLIAYNKDVSKLYEECRKRGYDNPVVTYLNAPKVSFCY